MLTDSTRETRIVKHAHLLLQWKKSIPVHLKDWNGGCLIPGNLLFRGANSHLNPPFPEHSQSIDSILIREISCTLQKSLLLLLLKTFSP